MARIESAASLSRCAVFRVAQGCDWCASKISAYPWRSVWAFIALVVICSLVRACHSKMWIDEFYTFFVVRQPTTADVMSALRAGADSTPPTFSLLLRATEPVFGQGALDLRMPGLFGICLMGVCVFAFAYRRMAGAWAFLTMLFACDATIYYATEGRPYGLGLGLCALALFSWQTAAEGRHRRIAIPALTLSLWLATAVHYYSMALIVPLLVAELVRWRLSGKFDASIVTALIIVPAVLTPHLSLMRAQTRFVPHYHAKASLHSLVEVYAPYVPLLGVLVAALIIYALCRYGYKSGNAPAGHQNGAPRTLIVHELLALSVLTLLPILIIAGSMLTVKAFVDRYVLWTVLGVSVLAATILLRITRGSTVAAGSAIIFLLLAFGAKTVVGIRNGLHLREAEPLKRLLADAPSDGTPILIADHHKFVELSYYGDVNVRPRLVYAVSPELAIRYTNVDTGELVLTALEHRSSLHIVPYRDFVRTYHRFLLAADAEDWLVWQLQQSGYRVSLISRGWEPGLFEVNAAEHGELAKYANR
jgi:hypothetical protein